MKKKIPLLPLIGLLVGCGITVLIYQLNQSGFHFGLSPSSDKGRHELVGLESEHSGIEVSGKISELRKKYALRGLIIDGESYLESEQYGLALKNFSEALSTHPNNSFLLEKIGETYFSMKKFEASYHTYTKIENPGQTTKEMTLLSLMYSKGYKISASIEEVTQLIDRLKLTPEGSFYYKSVLGCSLDFHGCKKSIENYLQSNKTNIKEEKLLEYRNTLTNYENFRLEDMYYKNTLILGHLFKQKLYPLVIHIGLNLNKEKPDYKPVLQMIAQSFFEVGEYASAKAFLDTYLKYEPSDASAWYLMGIINLKLQEYIISNIQLNKAYELGFEPKLTIKRQIIYNLYILEQTDRMLNELSSLINGFDNYKERDLYLAIYYHIINGKTDEALALTIQGTKKFSSDANLYGYYGWIYKEKGDLDTSLSYLQKGLDIDPKNPLILLNLGYLFEAKGSSTRSKIYFSKLIESSPKSEFAKQAEVELTRIEQNLQESKNQAQ